jgi:hypothetical protein
MNRNHKRLRTPTEVQKPVIIRGLNRRYGGKVFFLINLLYRIDGFYFQGDRLVVKWTVVTTDYGYDYDYNDLFFEIQRYYAQQFFMHEATTFRMSRKIDKREV